MDSKHRERQAEMLPIIVEGVRGNPGFVQGFWSEDVEDEGASVTFIVFETLDQANAFRDVVLANAPAQAESGVERGQLRIVKITAQA